MWSWSACRRLVDTQKRLSAQEAHFIKEKEDAASTIAGMQQDMDRSAGCIKTLESVRLTEHVQAQRWKCQIGCWFWEVGSVYLCGCRSCDHTYSWKAKVEDLLAKYQPFCVSWLYPIATKSSLLLLYTGTTWSFWCVEVGVFICPSRSWFMYWKKLYASRLWCLYI